MNPRCHLMREHSPDECGWDPDRVPVLTSTPDVPPELKRYRLRDGRVGAYREALLEVLTYWTKVEFEATHKIAAIHKEIKRCLFDGP